MVRILLATDHPLVGRGLRALLERDGLEVVADVTDPREALLVARDAAPDVAVLDLGAAGVETARGIVRASPRTKPVLLTMHSESDHVHEAVRAGVRGYLLKSKAAADLVPAVREVAAGAVYLSPNVLETVVQAYLGETGPRDHSLTPRELQVLELVAEGKTTREIAALLGVSAKTAETHRMRLMKKAGVHEAASLVRYAIRRGVVRP
jgi:DNA-binding NarL/FixJ family response regulator